MTYMDSDGSGGSSPTNMSAEKAAARAWLERCAPEYRAILDQALSADPDWVPASQDGGFLDSWQETREQTQTAVRAFIDAQDQWNDKDPDPDCKLCMGDGDSGYAEAVAGEIKSIRCSCAREWVDPCPTWDELRAMLHFRLNPGTPKDERMRARYEAGRKQYREDWTKWSVERVTDMIAEEDDDAAIYRAMRKHIMRDRGLL